MRAPKNGHQLRPPRVAPHAWPPSVVPMCGSNAWPPSLPSQCMCVSVGKHAPVFFYTRMCARACVMFKLFFLSKVPWNSRFKSEAE